MMLDKQRMIQLHSLRIKFRRINKSMEMQVALIASSFDHGVLLKISMPCPPLIGCQPHDKIMEGIKRKENCLCLTI